MSRPFAAKLEVLADAEDVSRRVADWMLQIAVAKDGDFAVCLSGGSTPRRLYERLAGAPIRTHSLGRERIGSGETSDLCPAMTR